MKKYIPVDVYKNPLGDCTMNGVTVTANMLLVEVPDGYIGEEEIKNRREKGENVVVLVVGRAGNRDHLKPEGEKRWTMFGGNFVYSSDSRFGRVYGARPMHVHDRIEG